MILTVEDCKAIIKKLGQKFNIDPKLISTRLLSADDKQAMLSGKIGIDALLSAIEAWKEAGYPDYANGNVCRISKNDFKALLRRDN